MRKRTLIIITIISTIISLIMIFFSYFGITRYFLCYNKSTDKLIENYTKLPKASNDNKVVISFTCNRDKLDKLKPFINSILDQTVKVDLIAIITPLGNKEEDYTIPKYIKNILAVFPSGKDYGKGTKLIPMILREKEKNTIIIALDENKIYGQDFIYTMVEESKKYPDSVLVDKKGSAILVRSEHFEYDVINREKNNLDNEWFLKKAKNSKIVDYNENYGIINF
jgi:cellulose synthase/poly-beta-1,6-N-acetylglucosamine synthase-like glycosyltransferase